nr:lytic transglycosylase domain-containing protein [Sphingomonas formosensis]
MLVTPGQIGALVRLAGLGGAPAQAADTWQNDSVRQGIARWTSLHQSDSYAFSDYAGFLLSYPGWPGETAMRKTAERRIDPNSYSPGEVIAFFARFPPLTQSGNARYAEALSAMGRMADAQAAARKAWLGGALSPDDESRLLGRFGSSFTQDDQDRRMERLLWDRATAAAQRQLARTSPIRQPLFAARLALQAGQPGAAGMIGALGPAALRDPGVIADRTRWLRDSGQGVTARSWLSQPMTLDQLPFDGEKWLETLLTIARGAAADNQWTYAWGIASQADTAFAPGTDVRLRTLGERDDYTSLVWLAGMAALQHLGRPADAVGMFDRYARAAKSPQTQARGWYWAGRAAQAAGRPIDANGYYAKAAAHGEQFYGQLAAERLGQPVAPPVEPAQVMISESDRVAFETSSIVRAARLLGQMGNWEDQTAFIRAIAANADSDADHRLAAELARSIGRPDLGVMIARNAMRDGSSDYVRSGFPEISVPPAMERQWTMIHAISRQESQFDRAAVSHAGARGLMQLMPRTAQEIAGKLGMPYDYNRLTQDTSYNVMLGSAFFANILDQFGGNHVLAVAAYNAGPGNVRKWLAANGDPRMPGVDVINWIEAIPISETRNYVQRVLENAVVYDALNPDRARMPERNRLSAYLGKSTPG